MERAQKALVETVILAELERNGNMSLDELTRRVRAIGGFDERVDDAFVRNCAKRLDRDGHLEQRDGRFAITDDGRQDVRRIEGTLCCVTAAEVPGTTVPDEYLQGRGGAGMGGAGGTLGGPPGP